MAETSQTKLTAGQIKYLLAISKLCENSPKVKCKEIAEYLGISKPSVHTMISGISDLGLIKKPHYGKVTITETGKETIAEYKNIFLTAEKYFNKILDLKPVNAKKAAYALICDLDINSLIILCDKMKVLLKCAS